MEPKTFRGVVQKGEQRGSELGFKTVNIPLADTEVSGIYAARVTLKPGDAPYMAAVYADQKRHVLEAHLLDFNDELYGLDIEIVLLEKLREDKKFTDDAALREAIESDISAVRAYFAR